LFTVIILLPIATILCVEKIFINAPSLLMRNRVKPYTSESGRRCNKQQAALTRPGRANAAAAVNVLVF